MFVSRTGLSRWADNAREYMHDRLVTIEHNISRSWVVVNDSRLSVLVRCRRWCRAACWRQSTWRSPGSQAESVSRRRWCSCRSAARVPALKCDALEPADLYNIHSWFPPSPTHATCATKAVSKRKKSTQQTQPTHLTQRPNHKDRRPSWPEHTVG